LVLSAILVVIVINTIGVSHVVQTSLQDSLNSTQADASTILKDPTPPSHVPGEPYYVPPQTDTSNPNSTDIYGGDQYTGGYNYDKWVHDNPKSAYNARPAGSSVPQPGVGNNNSQGN